MHAHVITETPTTGSTSSTPTPASPPAGPVAGTAGSSAAGTAGGPAGGEWWSLSAAMTAQVGMIADREDLVVSIAPGAGRGAPACFLPGSATIEIDGTHLGSVDPASAVPDHVSD